MSGRSVKINRRVVRKEANNIVKDHIRYIHQMGLRKRIRYALIIIFKIKRGL